MLLGLLVAAAGSVSPLSAQQRAEPIGVSVGDTVQQIRLVDGSVLVGRVVAVRGDRIEVETTAGARVELMRAQIRSVRPVRGTIQNGQIWAEDPNTSRLFFGPTARTVPAGDGYFGVFELVFPYVAFGVTDYLTVAGGTPIIPGVIGEIVYLAPKVRIVSAPSAQVAAGALAFFAPGEDFSSAGILFGVGTFGSLDNAVTVGAGYGFAGEEFANKPVLMAGAEARLSRRTKFITENYLVLYEDAVFDGSFDRFDPRTETRAVTLLSAGVRFFGEQLSADAGLGFAVGEGDGCCLPVVNFIYNFGGNR